MRIYLRAIQWKIYTHTKRTFQKSIRRKMFFALTNILCIFPKIGLYCARAIGMSRPLYVYTLALPYIPTKHTYVSLTADTEITNLSYMRVYSFSGDGFL